MQEENILKFIKPVFLLLFGFDAWSEVLVEPADIATLCYEAFLSAFLSVVRLMRTRNNSCDRADRV